MGAWLSIAQGAAGAGQGSHAMRRALAAVMGAGVTQAAAIKQKIATQPFQQAPEILNGEAATRASDVFSWVRGCCAYSGSHKKPGSAKSCWGPAGARNAFRLGQDGDGAP